MTLAALALSGGFAPPKADAGVLVGQAPEEIAAYWTPERMEAAIPVGGWSRGSEAAPSARARGSLHSRVRKVKRFPKRTHGKVFFSIGATDYVCSGTVVDAPNRSLVWTAGHCVYEPGLVGGSFATNWEFVPAYRGGHAPFGEWPAVALQTTPQFKDSGTIGGLGFDPTFDLGAATVARSPRGRPIQRVVGARGIAFNRPARQQYHAFGYPAVQPPAEFTGRRMFRCDSRLTGRDASVGPPASMRIACDMTPGSSGGGWVSKGGNVMSVTSYGYNDDPRSLYGPYMGSAARNLYRSEKR